MSRPDAAPRQLSIVRPLRAVPDPVPHRPEQPAQKPEPLWREIAGAALKDRRLQQRRTLRQVADRAGISAQYLSEIERGRKEPSSEMLASLCGAMGLTLTELLMAATLRSAARPAGPTLMAA